MFHSNIPFKNHQKIPTFRAVWRLHRLILRPIHTRRPVPLTGSTPVPSLRSGSWCRDRHWGWMAKNAAKICTVPPLIINSWMMKPLIWIPFQHDPNYFAMFFFENHFWNLKNLCYFLNMYRLIRVFIHDVKIRHYTVQGFLHQTASQWTWQILAFAPVYIYISQRSIVHTLICFTLILNWTCRNKTQSREISNVAVNSMPTFHCKR